MTNQDEFKDRVKDDVWVMFNKHESVYDLKNHTFGDKTFSFLIRHPGNDLPARLSVYEGNNVTGMKVDSIHIGKELVDSTIKYFDQKENVSLEDIDKHLDVDSYIKEEMERSAAIRNDFEERFNYQPEDRWFRNDTWLGEEILKHSFGDLTVGFGISYSEQNSKPELTTFQQFDGYGALVSGKIEIDNNTAKQLVNNTISFFDKNHPTDANEIGNYLESFAGQQKEVIHEMRQEAHTIELAKKTGYVQGVCEAVLAIDKDENRWFMTESGIKKLSKKLLTEMNVTKDMAKKYANPETYKKLEKGILAHEQKLEQAQGVKR